MTDFLHVNEIELFQPAYLQNVLIEPASVTMSSQYNFGGENFKAANCIDGNKATTCSTNTGDPNPTMVISYDCLTGSTPKGLKVVVTNRPGLESRLSKFTLTFVNSDGINDGDSFSFAETKATYTIFSHRECGGRSHDGKNVCLV